MQDAPTPDSPSRVPAPRARSGRLGTTFLETIVSLAILGIILILGMTFFSRRRELERERADRETALRALRSEWAILRTSSAYELVPQDEGSFLGPKEFLETIEDRNPVLTVEKTAYRDLVFVRLEIGTGFKVKSRIKQEGWVRTGDGG